MKCSTTAQFCAPTPTHILSPQVGTKLHQHYCYNSINLFLIRQRHNQNEDPSACFLVLKKKSSLHLILNFREMNWFLKVISFHNLCCWQLIISCKYRAGSLQWIYALHTFMFSSFKSRYVLCILTFHLVSPVYVADITVLAWGWTKQAKCYHHKTFHKLVFVLE